MKHRFAGMCSLVAALCLGLALTACSSDEQGYQPEPLTPVVDAPVIIETGVLHVGIDADDTPFAGSANGTTIGYNVDVAAALANELGCKLELVDVGDEGGPAALAAGEVDVVVGLMDSEADGSLWMSAPYVQSGVTLFAAASDAAAPASDATPLVAAQVSSKSAWAVENAYGDAALVAQANLQSAFTAIQSGEAEYAAADGVIGTYAALDAGVDVVPVAMFETPTGYHVATLSSNAELQDAVGTALTSLTDGGVLNLITMRWLGTTLDLSGLPVIESTVPEGEETEEPPSIELTEETTSTAGSNAVVL